MATGGLERRQASKPETRRGRVGDRVSDQAVRSGDRGVRNIMIASTLPETVHGRLGSKATPRAYTRRIRNVTGTLEAIFSPETSGQTISDHTSGLEGAFLVQLFQTLPRNRKLDSSLQT